MRALVLLAVAASLVIAVPHGVAQTRTQTYQPGEPRTGLPGGAPGRGNGTGPSGAPSVYCQNWPGNSPYPQYRGTGPQTPCGPAFQRPPPARGGNAAPSATTGGGPCVRSPPAATGLYSLRDVARVVASTYGPYGGRHYPIFIAKVIGGSYDWLVALAGIDSYAQANGQSEVNSWATANYVLNLSPMALEDPYAQAVVRAMAQFGMSSRTRMLLVGHSLGGITAQNLLYYAQPPLVQVSDLPQTRIVTLGSPVLTYPRFLAPNTTIDRFPGTNVRYFAAFADVAVNGPSAYQYRVQAPPLQSNPPIFNWVTADRAPDPHSAYHTSRGMLEFNPRGDRPAGFEMQLDPRQQYRCTTTEQTPPPIPFGQSGPDQTPPSCALVDVKTMVADVVRVRRALVGRPELDMPGNVAVAYVSVPGLRCFLSASSRIESVTPADTQQIGLVGMATGFYESREVPTKSPGQTRPAHFDTENKILDAIGRGINVDPQRVGVIQLFTERRPCPSCDDVIGEFGRKQPNITLMILDNAGNVIQP
jgi:hypothetical protein